MPSSSFNSEEEEKMLIWQEAAIKKVKREEIIANWRRKRAYLVKKGYKNSKDRRNYSLFDLNKKKDCITILINIR